MNFTLPKFNVRIRFEGKLAIWDGDRLFLNKQKFDQKN